MATEAETPEPVPLTKIVEENIYLEKEQSQSDGLVDETPPGESKKFQGPNAEYSVEKGKMQVAAGAEAMNTGIEANVETVEGERFFESSSVVEVSCKDTYKVSKRMDHVKIEVADESRMWGSKIMEESEEKPEKNDKSPVIENFTGNSLRTSKGILKQERSVDSHSEQDVPVEDKSLEKEIQETGDGHQNEKVESNEEVISIPETKSDQAGEDSVRVPDLTTVSFNEDVETIVEEESGETTTEEIENTAEKSTKLVGEENIMNEGTGEAFTQSIAACPEIQSYEEATLKITEGDEVIVYKPYAISATEASSRHEKDLKENIEVIEKIRKDGGLSVHDGVATTDGSSCEDICEEGSTSIVTKDNTGDAEIINALEHSQSGKSSHEERPENLQEKKPEEEKLERSLSVVDKDFIVATSTEYAETIEEEACIKIQQGRYEEKIIDALEHSQSGTSDGEEKPGNLSQYEPEEKKLEGSLSVVTMDSSIVASTKSAATRTRVQEESLEETMKEELPIHADTQSKNEIPEDKDVPHSELNEKKEGAEVEVPNENVNDIHDPHPLIQVAKQTEEINLDNISSFEPEGKAQEVNEASTEEKHIEDPPEPYQRRNSTILEHLSVEREGKIELTLQTNETDVKEHEEPESESEGKPAIKGNIDAENLEEENNIKQVIEQESVEQVSIKGLEDEKKKAAEATGEFSENFKIERAAESIERKASKTIESPQEIPDTWQVPEEESLQKEEKNLTATESSLEEKPEKNEPEEKFEQPLQLITKKSETFSSEANETPCQMEERATETLEEAPQKEETEKETEENNDIEGNKIAIEQDLQMVVEISNGSECIETAVLKPKTEISNMVAEDDIKMEDTKELLESWKDTGKNEEAEKHDRKAECVIIPEAFEEKTAQLSEEDNKEEEAPKIEVLKNIVDQSREREIEKIELSSEEGHSITTISSELIEQETVVIHPGNTNEVEKSGGENNSKQIVEETNVRDLIPESVNQVPVKNLEDEEQEARDFTRENFEPGKEETTENSVNETCKTTESVGEIPNTLEVKQGESLQSEKKNETEKILETEKLEKLLPAESNENKAFGDTEIINALEHSQSGMSSHEERPENLRQSKPEEEKLERSLSVVDKDFIVAVSTKYGETIEEEVCIKIQEGRYEEKIIEALEHSQSGTSDNKEKPENLSRNEPEEKKLEGSLSVVTVYSSIVPSIESAETMIRVQGETPFKSPEESFEDIMHDKLPIHTDTDSKIGIPEDKDVPQSELNEKIEGAEFEVPNENANEPEGKAQEVNEGPTEEKHIEDSPESYQSRSSTILEHLSPEGEMKTELTPEANKTDIIGQNVPELESDGKPEIKGNIAAEKLEEENNTEQESVEQVSIKCLEDEAKKAEGAPGEISVNFKTKRVVENIEHEASKTIEGPQEIPDTFQVKEEESLQKEEKNLTATESSLEENPEKNEPEEKFEQPLKLITKKNETFSSEANETPPQREEGTTETLEEAPEKEETEKAAEENNDTEGKKIALEQDLQMVVETSSGSECIETAVLEPKTEISNMVAEDDIKMEDTKELLESCKDTEKNEEAEKHDRKEECVIIPEAFEEKTAQCSKVDKKEEEAPKIEVLKNIVYQSRELEIEKIEQSSEEGHSATNISSELIEQETVVIHPGDTNEVEKSGGENNLKQIVEETNNVRDLIPDTYQVKQGESSQSEKKNETITESSPEEKSLETEKLEKLPPAESNENEAFGDTEIINALDNSQSGMSSHEERLENLHQNKPEEEKLERSLSVVDENITVSVSTEYAEAVEEEACIKIQEGRYEEKSIDALEHSQSETSDHKEKPENLSRNEPVEGKLEGSLTAVTVDSSIVASTESAETTTRVQGETPFTSLEESFEEIMKDELPIHTDTDSKNEIPEDKDVPQSELNVKIEGAEVEVPNENANEPEGKGQEVNEASIEERHIEDLPETCQIRNLTNLEYLSTEAEVTTELTPQINETDIIEHNVPELESEGKPEIKGNIATEKLEEENSIEQAIEQESVEQVFIKSLEDEENKAEKATGEISENFKTERATESIEGEASKTIESPQEIPATCQVKEEESLQKEEKNQTATESSLAEKPEKNEPEEKFEQPLKLITEKNETFSSEAKEIPPQMEERTTETLEEAPQNEETEENNDTEGNKIAIEQDPQMVVDISNGSERIETAVLKPKTEISNMVAEDDINMEDTKELFESCKDMGKNEEAQKHDRKEECVVIPEGFEDKTAQCYEEDKKVEEAPKTEVLRNIFDQSRELEIEKTGQSSEEGHTVTNISLEFIEQETDVIHPGDKNEVEKSRGENNLKQIVEETNVRDLILESVDQIPIKNLEDEEKEAKDFIGEVQNFESEKEETTGSSVNDACKTTESVREIPDTFQVKQGESLQSERKNETVTKFSPEERSLETEKLEKLLPTEFNENKAIVSGSNEVDSQKEEGSPHNHEEAPQREEYEKEIEDRSGTKEKNIALVKDHQVDAEISDTCKSTESTILETMAKMKNMVVDNDMKKEEPKEINEDFKDAEEFEETQKHDTIEECDTTPAPIGENIVQSSEDYKKEEETPKVQACAQLEAISVSEDDEKRTQNEESILDKSKEPEAEKTEQSSIEDHTVPYILSKSIKCETTKTYPGNANEVKNPGEDENQIVEENNIRDCIPESVEQVSFKNFENEEKKAEEPTREGFEKSETDKTTESVTKEICETTESPRKIIDTFQVKQEEDSGSKELNATATEKKPEEKTEKSFSLTSDKNEAFNSGAENLLSQMEDEAPQNLEEAPHEEENEKKTKDNKTTIEKDNQAAAETCDTSKSTERIILEPQTKMDRMVDEDGTGKEQSEELCEDKDGEVAKEKENIVEQPKQVEVEKTELSCIEEHVIANLSWESTDWEATVPGNETKAEESEGKNDAIIEDSNIGNLIPKLVEQVSLKNLEDEEKKANESTGEILNNPKTEEAADNTELEISKTLESSREIPVTIQEKHGESLQSEEKDPSAIESSQNLEESPQKEERENVTDEKNYVIEENRIAVEESLQQVVGTSDANKTTESVVHELKTEKDNMVVEDDVKKEESKEFYGNSEDVDIEKHQMVEECVNTRVVHDTTGEKSLQSPEADEKEEETSKIELEKTGVVQDAGTQSLKGDIVDKSTELEAHKPEKSCKEDYTFGYISPESIERETVEISTVSVNKNAKSGENNNVVQMIEESNITDLIPETVEQVPVKSLEDEEMKAQASTGEISHDTKVEEATQSIENETGKSKTMEIPREAFDTFQVKQEESLPSTEKNVTVAKESPPELNIDESLSLILNANGGKILCPMEDGASQIEGAPMKAEKENETEDNNEFEDKKIPKEEDLQVVAETSDASKSAESIIQEPKSEMDSMTAEDDIKNEESQELRENFVDVAKVEIKQHDVPDESVSTKEIVESSKEDKKDEETPEIEACSYSEPTRLEQQSREFEVDETEQSFKEEHTVADISPQSIEQEVAETHEERKNKAEESKGKNIIEQMVEESNIDTTESSTEKDHQESQPEEKLDQLLPSTKSEKNEAFSTENAKMTCQMEEKVAQNLEEAPQKEEHMKETDDNKDNKIKMQEEFQKGADRSKSTECTNISPEPTGEKIHQSSGDDKKEEETSSTEANSISEDAEEQSLKQAIVVDQSREEVEKVELNSEEDDMESKMPIAESKIAQKVDEDVDAKKHNIENDGAKNNIEILDNPKTEEATDNAKIETGKTLESSREILHTFPEKHGESLESEEKDQTAIESSPNLVEAQQKEEKENLTKEKNDTEENRIAVEESLQEVAGTSYDDKTTESVVLELKSKEDNMVVEDDVKKEVKEFYGNSKDVDIEKHEMVAACVRGEKSLQSHEADKKEEKTSKIELEETGVIQDAETQCLKEEDTVDKSTELEAHKSEKSFKEDYTFGYISPESIEQETVEISPVSVNKKEKSEGKNNVMQMVEESNITDLIPESVEQAHVKNLEDEEKKADMSKGEISNTKVEEVTQSVENETGKSKTMEIPRKALDTFQVEQGENLPTEEKNLTAAKEPPPELKIEESISLISNADGPFSSDGGNMPCLMEDRASQIEGAPMTAEKENETKDGNKSKEKEIPKEEDLQVVAETSDSSKSAESVVLEPLSEMDNTTTEDDIKNEESRELCENFVDVAKVKEIEQHDVPDKCVSTKEIVESFEGDKKEEETPKIEVCSYSKPTRVEAQSREIEVEKTEQIFKEEHAVADISPQPIEREAAETDEQSENKAEESEDKNRIEQAVQESNIDTTKSSIEKIPQKSEHEEKLEHLLPSTKSDKNEALGSEDAKMPCQMEDKVAQNLEETLQKEECMKEIDDNKENKIETKEATSVSEDAEEESLKIETMVDQSREEVEKVEQNSEEDNIESKVLIEESKRTQKVDEDVDAEKPNIEGDRVENNIKILDNPKTEEVVDSTELETSKTLESPREIPVTIQEKHGESLQTEKKDLSAVESSQNLEEAPQKEEKENVTEEKIDTDENKIAVEQSLQEVAGTSDANKTIESAVLELKTEKHNMVVEDDVKKEESKEFYENFKDTKIEKLKMIEECVNMDILQGTTGEKSLQDPRADEKKEQTSKFELEETDVVRDAETQTLKEGDIVDLSTELEAHISQKSFKEDYTIDYISPASIEQETIEISPVSVNKQEKSEGKNNVVQMVEESNITDLIPSKNLEDKEKAEPSTVEISNDTNVEEASLSIENETGKSKTMEIPREAVGTFQVKQGENLPTEEKNLTATKESPPELKIEESLSLISNGPFSSDGGDIPCLMENGASQIEGAPMKTEKQNETEDNNESNDRKIPKEKDHQVVAETSDASKTAESIVLELKSEMDKMTAEDDIKNEERREFCENFVDVAKVEEIEQHDVPDECVSTKEIVESSEEGKKEEETPKIQVCSYSQPTRIEKHAREFEVDKTEQSFKEEHTVADVSLQSIEQEAVEIHEESENKAEESEGKNKTEQVVEKSNINATESSIKKTPGESEAEEKLKHLLPSTKSNNNETFSSENANVPCQMEEKVAQDLEEAPQKEEHMKENEDNKDSKIDMQEEVQEGADSSKSRECRNISLEPAGEKIHQSFADDKKEEETFKTEANCVSEDAEEQTLKEEIMLDQSREEVEKVERNYEKDDMESRIPIEESQRTQKVDEDVDAKKQNIEGDRTESNTEAYETADFIASREIQSMEDRKEGLTSFTVEEDTVVERSPEDERKAIILKEQVDELRSALVEEIKETSTKEKVSETLKDSAKSNVSSSTKEITECLVEKSSLVSEASEEITEKKETIIDDSDFVSGMVATEEICLTETERKGEKKVECLGPAFEENSIIGTETNKTMLETVDIDVKPEDITNLGEQCDKEIPTAADQATEKIENIKENEAPDARSEGEKAATTGERPSEETPEEVESSTKTSKEHEIVTSEARDTTNPSNVSEVGPVHTDEKPANEEVQKERSEDLSVRSELDKDNPLSASEGVEISKREETRELADRSDDCAPKTLEDAESSISSPKIEKTKDNQFDEALKSTETYSIRAETAKDVLEQEIFEGKDLVEVEKEAIEQKGEAESQSLEDKDTKYTPEEIVKSADHDRILQHATEAGPEDESNEMLPESDKNQIEENCSNIEKQEDENEINEKEESKLQTDDLKEQNANKMIKASILAEEALERVEQSNGSKVIKESVLQEEHCINEPHEIFIVGERTDEASRTVQDSSTVYSEDTGTLDLKKKMETEILEVEESSIREREAYFSGQSKEQKVEDSCIEPPAELEEKIEEITESSKTHNATLTTVTETIPGEAQLHGRLVEDQGKPCSEKTEIEYAQQGEGVTSIEIEETTSDLTTKLQNVENIVTGEPDQAKMVSEQGHESKGQGTEETAVGKCPTVEKLDQVTANDPIHAEKKNVAASSVVCESQDEGAEGTVETGETQVMVTIDQIQYCENAEEYRNTLETLKADENEARVVREAICESKDQGIEESGESTGVGKLDQVPASNSGEVMKGSVPEENSEADGVVQTEIASKIVSQSKEQVTNESVETGKSLTAEKPDADISEEACKEKFDHGIIGEPSIEPVAKDEITDEQLPVTEKLEQILTENQGIEESGESTGVEELDQVPATNSGADGVVETEIASKIVSQSKEQGTNESIETGKSLSAEKPDADESKEACKETFDHGVIGEPSIEPVAKGEITEEQRPLAKKLEEQILTENQGIEESGESAGVNKLDQVPATNSGDVMKGSVPEENSEADGVVETEIASKIVSQSNEQSTNESAETGKSRTAEKPDADKSEEACKETSNQGVIGEPSIELVAKCEITDDQCPPAEKLEEWILTALPSEHGATTTVENTEEEKTENKEKMDDDGPNDSLAAKSTEEISSQKKTSSDLEASTPGLSTNMTIEESPTEVHWEEGQTPLRDTHLEHSEDESMIKCIDSSSTSKDIIDETRQTDKACDVNLEKSEKAVESILESEVTDMRAEENHSQKTSEANIITESEVWKEEIKEEKKLAETYQPSSLGEEKMTEGLQEDELRPGEPTGEKTNLTFDTTLGGSLADELSTVIEKATASKTITEQVVAEDRSLEEQLDRVSVEDKMVKESFPNKSEELNVEESSIKVDSTNQDSFENVMTGAGTVIDEESSVAILQKENVEGFEKGSKLVQETQKLEETSVVTSEKQITREATIIDCPETIASTGSEQHLPPVLAEGIQETSRNVDADDFTKGVHSEAKEVKHGEDIIEESTIVDSDRASLQTLFQKSTRERSQVDEEIKKEREATGGKEEMQSQEAENCEEEGDEHKKTDSGSDAPVMVEASRDMEVKVVPHKKSILSGVGSKVKHSISKVKKAITGKSTHHSKPVSPKRISS